MLPGLLYLIANNYIPMFGILIAFKKINFAKGIFASSWCGLETCLQDVYTLTFEEDTVKITAENNSPWQFAGQEPILAVLE